MKPMTEKHLAILRRHMVEVIDIHFDLMSEEIGRDRLDFQLREALLKVPRHLFVPKQFTAVAYQDMPLPIGFDKTVSQPFIGALMLDLLEITPGARILEIGTGLGYQAAVMAEMGARLFTVEVVEEFAEAAQALLHALGSQVSIRVGDGTRGWPEHGPFDAILLTAATASLPQSLVDQLKPGGRIVAPLGDEAVQQLSVIEKQDDSSMTARSIMPVRFTWLETGG